MLKWVSVIVVLGLASSSAVADLDYRSLAAPVEVRAIWVDASAIPKSDGGVRKLVRSFHDANINVLFPEVVARGYAVYESKLLGRDPRFAGTPDSLPVMIKEAHRLGMEVHPWVWVFRAGYTKDRGAILTAHPDWVELSKDGSDLSPNGGLWISPCIAAARDFLADVFEELVCKYDVDGLHLDYIRYESESSAPYGYSPASLSLFERQYGFDPARIQPFDMDQYQWNKFRERQINTFVQRIALQTRRLKPHVKLSAAVSPNPKSARLDLMQNWVNWIDNKWLDFVVPMSYSTDDQYFRRLLNAESTAAGGKALIVSGIGLSRHPDPQQTVTQIGYSREKLLAGQALFSASYCKPDRAAALKNGPYACGARLPFRDTESAIQQLRACATAQGSSDLAGYLSGLADSLGKYLDYRQTPIPYVPPTPPPFTIRDYTAQ
jgi:uncharacterized lipoprotein YddW (UPF0748 family)